MLTLHEVITFLFSIHISISSLHTFHFFFFNDTATTEIYTLSLHDALPISDPKRSTACSTASHTGQMPRESRFCRSNEDRKSTRLNSSHGYISYAVFCLKKKTRSWSVCKLA